MNGRTSKFVIRHGDDCLDASGGRFVCMRDGTIGSVQQHFSTGCDFMQMTKE
jgi:hypothetical protein